MSTATAKAEDLGVLEHLDPGDLLVEENGRTDLDLDADFLASIKEQGVLEPVRGYRNAEGAVVVRMGQRRRAAAIQTGRPTIPVYIVADTRKGTTKDEIDRIFQQWDENERRKAFTTGEKAQIAATLFDLKVPERTIRRRLRLGKDELVAAQQVASSPAAVQAANELALDMEQARAIAGVEGDADAVATLIDAAKAGPGQFAHKLQEVHDDRAMREALDAARAELEADGTTITEEFPGYNPEGNITSLGDLAGEGGMRLTAEAHATCPGRVAYLDAEIVHPHGEERRAHARVRWYCSDPQTYGHQKFRYTGLSGGTRSGPMSEAEKAERSRVVSNNKKWRTAEPVRRKAVKDLLARPRPPKGTLQFIAEELIYGDHAIRRALEEGHEFARADLFGLPEPTERWGPGRAAPLQGLLGTANDARVQVVCLGLLLAAYEKATDVGTWKTPGDAARRYFAFLQSAGYELSEVEQLVLAVPAQPGGQPSPADFAAHAASLRTGDQPGPDDEPGDQPGPDDEPGDQPGPDDEPGDQPGPDDPDA